MFRIPRVRLKCRCISVLPFGSFNVLLEAAQAEIVIPARAALAVLGRHDALAKRPPAQSTQWGRHAQISDQIA
jgi:hypothetical protein